LGGILKPSSGQILFNGQDICTYHDDRLSEYRSQKVGFMFQFASLMPILNTKENVLLPILFFNGQKSREELALQYLNEVGLSDKVNSYPAELSGGQQRRVAIARALINEPEIILADEPTGDLDEKTEADVMALFKRLNKNRNVTIIMVTHNLTLAKEAQRTLVMTQGTLSEKKGTPRIVQKIQTTPPKRDKQRKPRR
jgi:putative ABC transport system ATP-binding protein/lipoprotein-releasing system ATP-binding protein